MTSKDFLPFFQIGKKKDSFLFSFWVIQNYNLVSCLSHVMIKVCGAIRTFGTLVERCKVTLILSSLQECRFDTMIDQIASFIIAFFVFSFAEEQKGLALVAA